MIKRLSSGYRLGDVLYTKAQALIALEQHAAAREALQEAQRAAEHMNARPILWRILAALARLAEESGDTDEADAMRQRARTLIAYIVDHIGAADLQASFLALREVRDLMGYVSRRPEVGGRQEREVRHAAHIMASARRPVKRQIYE
jgi:predicted ArsR family transcriptional regulator